jgi:uncharacterized protein YhhL (DUF1145 family)
MEASTFVHLFHILIVGGLFLYVGIVKTDIPKPMYIFLLVLGIIIILYHGFKVYKKLKDGKNPWVNYIHIFIVGPLLVYIGINREKTQRLYFEILLMLAFASIGYHGYYLFNNT